MSEPLPPRRALRRVGAVFAGFVAIVVLSIATDAALHATGVYPPTDQRMSDGLFVLATAYRIVYGVAGSWLTARLAPDRPMAHALVLGAIGTVIGLVGAIVMKDKMPEIGPLWYSIAIILIALPCGWIGGRLHARCAVRMEARGGV